MSIAVASAVMYGKILISLLSQNVAVTLFSSRLRGEN
jgi:hypothetical protein